MAEGTITVATKEWKEKKDLTFIDFVNGFVGTGFLMSVVTLMIMPAVFVRGFDLFPEAVGLKPFVGLYIISFVFMVFVILTLIAGLGQLFVWMVNEGRNRQRRKKLRAPRICIRFGCVTISFSMLILFIIMVLTLMGIPVLQDLEDVKNLTNLESEAVKEFKVFFLAVFSECCQGEQIIPDLDCESKVDEPCIRTEEENLFNRTLETINFDHCDEIAGFFISETGELESQFCQLPVDDFVVTVSEETITDVEIVIKIHTILPACCIVLGSIYYCLLTYQLAKDDLENTFLDKQKPQPKT